MAEIRADIAAYQEERHLLADEERWRAAAGGDYGPSLAPDKAACAWRLANLRRELYEVRVTASR